MTTKSHIQWTDATWNPTTGCTRVSAGCDNCYAFALHDRRYAQNRAAADTFFRSNDSAMPPDEIKVVFRPGVAREQGAALPWPRQYDLPFSRVQLLEDRLDDPLHWREPRRVFVDSMSDLFHEDVPFDYIDRVWIRMVLARRHTFQILTKRPDRMRAYCERDMPVASGEIDAITPHLSREERIAVGDWARLWNAGRREPPPNIWLGTSVEDQAAADERIPQLLETPAAVRFLSCEPLLGPVDLKGALVNCEWCGHHQQGRCTKCSCEGIGLDYVTAVDWVIVGGESGPRARPMDLAWVRALVAQCKATGVAVFVKQLGAKPVRGQLLIRETDDGERVDGYPTLGLDLRDRKGGDTAEWPEDLRIREFPS